MSEVDRTTPFTRTSSMHDEWIASARAEAARCRASGGSSTRHDAELLAPPPMRLWEELASRYDVGDEIRRGGQGVVYRALQRGTRRDVAIKVMHAAAGAESTSRLRFEREAQILAQLKHPNIVTVIENGFAGDAAYYVMDFVPGAPLDEFVRKQSFGPRQVCALLGKVCDAVNIAHLRGVIHRDLKPSNIRVDPAGEPRILDFGLAKLSEYDELAQGSDFQTATGQFLGSLPWASPEQVAAQPDRLDVRTDVYSLGVVLFHALTGRFPYRVDGAMREALDNICNAEPPAPSALQAGIDDDLDQIVLKCLRKDPEQRYQSAGDLARELRRYLAGEPIEAKRDSAWYMLRKRVRRYRVAGAIGGLVLLLAVNSLAAVSMFYSQERRLRQESENRRGEAERLHAQAEKSRVAADEARDEAQRQARVAQSINEFFSTRILLQAMPDRMGRDVLLRDVIQRASEEVDEFAPDDARTASEIHGTLGLAFRHLGEPEESLRHTQRAYEIAREAYGEDANFTLYTADYYARGLEEAGRIREAAEVSAHTLATRRQKLDPDDPNVITAAGSLGWTYARLGREQDALPLLREAYERALRVYGPESEETLTPLGNLAAALTMFRQYDEALELTLQQVEVSERVLGPMHEDTLRTRGRLGILYSYRGEFADAECTLRDVAEKQATLLGPEHLSTLNTRNNLATILARNRRVADGAAVLAEALEAARPRLSPRHTTLISMESNLGEMYVRLNRPAEALPLHEAAVSAATEVYPPGHEYLGLYHMRLGRALLNLNRLDDAERELQEGRRISAAALGEEAEDVREADKALARLKEAREKIAP